MWSKPIEHEADGMKVFEFPGSNILRHPRVCLKLLPFIAVAMSGTYFLIISTTNFWLCLLMPVIVMQILIVVLFIITPSKVNVAVMDGLLIIEEKSRYFEEHQEFRADEIYKIAFEADRQKRTQSIGILKIYLCSGENYALPCGKKHDLVTLADDIWQTLNPESNKSDGSPLALSHTV